MVYRNRGGVVPQHPSEEQEQIYLIKWVESAKKHYPDIEMIFHIPNGGVRSKAEAGRLKACGVRAGVPDLFLPVPKGKYHGLFIEMKVGNNKPTEEQKKWITRLRRNGYAAEVCYGWCEAWETLRAYYGQKEANSDDHQENH